MLPGEDPSASTTTGGRISGLRCLYGFRSGLNDEHVHTEVQLEDEYGNAVIGAGRWDGGIPVKRACDRGFYTAEILCVTARPGTNMVWDGDTPENGILLDPKPQ